MQGTLLGLRSGDCDSNRGKGEGGGVEKVSLQELGLLMVVIFLIMLSSRG
jgi:hypothetical protein